jgi:hypothetical protein
MKEPPKGSGADHAGAVGFRADARPHAAHHQGAEVGGGEEEDEAEAPLGLV